MIKRSPTSGIWKRAHEHEGCKRQAVARRSRAA